MKKIVKYLVLLIVISTIFCIHVKVHAEETKYETDYAVDIFGKSIDDGIGRFVCKTTDEEASKYDPQYISNQYWIFEYGRKESEINNNGNYVIVNYLKLPYFIQKDIETENICFGIQKGIWTETKILIEDREIKYNCYLVMKRKNETVTLPPKALFCYLEFLNLEVDVITEIRFDYSLYTYEYKNFWAWLKDKKTFIEHKISTNLTATSVEFDGNNYSDFQLKLIKTRWDSSPIETLSTPFLGKNGKKYTFKLFIGDFQNTYYLRQSTSDVYNENEQGIVCMSYKVAGVLYYTDNLSMEDLYIENPINEDTNILAKIIEFIKKYLN